MFFERKPDDRLTFESLTGIRDIIEFDTDLVWKEVSRRVNMEYDWKRKPGILFDHEDYKHCAFSTVPWETVEQFVAVRELFEKYLESDPHCIRSVGDFDSFSVYVDASMQLSDSERSYLRKRSGDVNRLRKALCAGWHNRVLGLRDNPAIQTAQQFADTLTACGVKCSRANVENGSKQYFAPNSAPPTDGVLAAIGKLQQIFPDVAPEALCATHVAVASIKPRRRPYSRLHTRGDWYYRGITIPAVGRIEPALQPSSEIKRIFEQPRDFTDPPLRWLSRQEYGFED
jgi:hypothetical protein